MYSIKRLLVYLMMPLAVASCSKEDEKVSSKTRALLQHKWKLYSRTHRSIYPPPNSGWPTLYYYYAGTPTDTYEFGKDGRVAFNVYSLPALLNYALLNDTTIHYAPYERYTWQEQNNPIRIRKLTDTLLVLAYPTYGSMTTSTQSIETRGEYLDSLVR